jgi:hypothetical protein
MVVVKSKILFSPKMFVKAHAEVHEPFFSTCAVISIRRALPKIAEGVGTTYLPTQYFEPE